MRGKRFFLFLVMIALGALLGMAYGWIVNPRGSGESTLQSLRHDYQADYVLMTAEVYAVDGDLDGALRRLEPLANGSAGQTIQNAIQSARELQWSESDLAKMEALAQAAGSTRPNTPTAAPEATAQAEEQP